MNNDFEVIGAFADGERVNAEALDAALASADGRRYLIDLVALREVAGDETPPLRAAAVRQTPRVRWVAIAAAAMLAIAAAYAAGLARGSEQPEARFGSELVTTAPAAPPQPTVVIKLRPGTTWQTLGGQP